MHAQTYYKMSYVDRQITAPEHRLCEDIPRFCDAAGVLLRDFINASVDSVVFAALLRSYTKSHKYTLAIAGYVVCAGVMTVTAQPNFAGMNRRQQELEGAPCFKSGGLGARAAGRAAHQWECDAVHAEWPAVRAAHVINRVASVVQPGVCCSTWQQGPEGTAMTG